MAMTSAPQPAAPRPRPLTPALVGRLADAGMLSPGRYLEALAMARDDTAWALWGRRLLLVAAVAHLLAAVIFFFAANWQDMPPFAKLTLLQAGVVVAALASRRPWHRAVREALLCAAIVLIGVTIAVFGQIYQTGADLYDLFFGWTVLGAPFALAAETAAAPVLWLVVAEIGLMSWMGTIAVPAYGLAPTLANVVLALLNAVILAGWEARGGPGQSLFARWPRLLLLTGALMPVFMPSFSYVFGDHVAHGPLALACFILLVLGAGWTYVRRRPDLAALSITVLFACSLALAALVESTLGGNILRLQNIGQQLLLAAEAILVFGAGAVLLRRLARGMPDHG